MAGNNSIYHPLAVMPVGDAYYINPIALAYLMRRDHLPQQCECLTLEMFSQFIQTAFQVTSGPYPTAQQAINTIERVAHALDVFSRLGDN
jgi:hypothetical protein